MNEAIIRRWYDIFKDNQELVEIRIIDPAKNNATYSGYFSNVDDIINAIRPYDLCNIFFTLNVINPACYEREQKDRIVTKPKTTTKDTEILGRKWCLIDIDVEKPSGTNSTDEEKELAQDVVKKVYNFLLDNGFEKPILCDSSNGYHILIKQAMKNTPENTQTMSNFLKVLDMFFSTDKVKIDTIPSNASRICKLYGTYGRKGILNGDRPQRLSKILTVPSIIKITPNEYFEKIAKLLPVQERNKFNNYGENKFDIEEFFTKHGIKVVKTLSGSNYVKYVLDECPFDSSHKAPDSAVFRLGDGSYGFKCFHSHCAGYTFRDFRLRYDPNAYDQQSFAEYQYKRSFHNPTQKEFKPIEETDNLGKKWLSLKDIEYVDRSKIVAIQTGFSVIDKKTMGLILGDVTVLSGLNSSGKSSFINCIALNAIQQGCKVAIWSGELQGSRLKNWIDLAAAGKNHVKQSMMYENSYFCPKNISEKIAEWADNKLFIYNNKYGNKWSQLFSDIKKIVDESGAQLIILDNLMATNIDNYDGDKNSQQSSWINAIKTYAKDKNIHFIIVAHPRKEMTFLRKESISGTADLTNLADNVIIIHRVNLDFNKRASDFLSPDQIDNLMKYNSVIEIAKNREFGFTDFIGLYFEIETKRLKNDVAEVVTYGWDVQFTQATISEHNVNKEEKCETIQKIKNNTAFETTIQTQNNEISMYDLPF